MFSYQRSLNAMGEVNYIVEWNDDLIPPWSTQGLTENIAFDNGTIQHVETNIPTGEWKSRFVRLRVVSK